MIKVLHITPHMSGGLARVLLSTLKYGGHFTPEVCHDIVTLDDITTDTKNLFNDFENRLYINKSHNYIASMIDEADVVQIEYWNHPLIYKFLLQFKFPPARILACCHVSGLYRPQMITKNMVDISDIFLAVTKATINHELFKNTTDNPLRDKLRFIRFPVDFERFNVKRVDDKNHFNVTYVGTVNYSKLHRNFLRMSANIQIPNVKFIVCGEDNPDNIELESKQYDPEIFDFQGFQKDISTVLGKTDVFAYPLNRTHFGSGEQVIIEAMYFGIPVVAFSNPAEAEIIENNVTGIIVNTEEEYVNAIENLHQNPEERKRMGRNAKAFVEGQLGPKRCLEGLNNIYNELMLRPKTMKTYFNHTQVAYIGQPDEVDLGAKLFIESLEGTGTEFLKSLENKSKPNIQEIDSQIANVELAMKTKTKGSLNQYLYFFPNDPYLNFWVGLIAQKEGRHKDAVDLFKRSLNFSSNINRVKDYFNISLSKI